MTEPSTLLLTNARTSADTSAEVEAVAIDDGLISWRGEVSDAPTSVRVIDLAGRWLLPGLTDSHTHLLAGAQQGLQATIDDRCASVDDFLAELERDHRALPDDEWLVATCELLPESLRERRFPTRSELDRLAPRRPLVVRCLGGHVALANSAAIEASGAELTDAPPEELEAGRLTEQSADALFRSYPSPSTDRLSEALVAQSHQYLRFGVTSAVEAAVGFTTGFDREWEVWEQLRKADSPFPLRMAFMLRLDPSDAAQRNLSPGPVDCDWQVKTLKFFADGIVGARTAAFRHDYLDCPGHRGDAVYHDELLAEHFTAAHRAGWQIAVHAIGDRAIDSVLSAYSTIRDPSRRHRIEHLALPDDEHIASVRDLGIHVATQHGFLPIMGDMFEAALGAERAQRLFPTRTLRSSGIPLAGSSDYPIGPMSPHTGLAGGNLRATGRGTVMGADETLSLAEILDTYIRGGAEIMHQEQVRGSLTPGHVADVAVFDEHPALANPASVTDLLASATVVRGELVHSTI